MKLLPIGKQLNDKESKLISNNNKWITYYRKDKNGEYTIKDTTLRYVVLTFG